jgi:hypothetical protein
MFRNKEFQVPFSLLFAAGFFLGLLFGPEDRGDSFPRKCQAFSELEREDHTVLPYRWLL